MKSVAAVVVTYNRKSFLKKNLTALLGQKRPPDEIIVVNNASTDGTHEMLQSEFPKLTVITLSENTGCSAGLAEGMRVALERGHSWLWLLDDDAIPNVDALDYLLRYLENSSDTMLGAVSSAVLNVPSGKILSGWCWEGGRRYRVPNQWHMEREAFEVDGVPFLGLLVYRSVVEGVGFPRADFFIWFDDVEFCYRIRKHGYKIIVIPKSLVSHPAPKVRIVKKFGREKPRELVPSWKAYYGIRNRLLVLNQRIKDGYAPWHTLPLATLQLLKKMLGTIVYDENRLERVKMNLLGIFHGLVGKSGKIISP